MKLRLLAASLAAVGMMAGSAFAAEVPLGDETFELYAAGDVITNMEAKAAAAEYCYPPAGDPDAFEIVGAWSSGANDLSAMADKGGTLYLALDTEGDVVTNTIQSASDLSNILERNSPYDTELEVSNGEIFLKSTITFVPSDEIEDSLPEGSETDDNIDNGDLKFALYAYEHEVTEQVEVEGNPVDQTTLVTNLVVYHSFYDGDDVIFSNDVITAAINFNLEQEVTVTMKRPAGSDETFFKVAVASLGADVASPLGYATFEDAALNGAPNGGPWFRTVNNSASKAVGSINFSGTGSVAGLTVGYNTVSAGTTYEVDLTGCANVVVSNLTANTEIADISTALDLEEGVQLGFYPTVGTITNVAVNTVEVADPATPYVYTVTTVASQVVTVLAGEEPTPAPTIITVTQTIGGHGGSISNGNFQAVSGVATPITITADQGYVVAQIVTNGAAVADALGETSVTFDAVFSDAEGANNSIVATFAPENAWYVEPFVRNEFGASLGNEGVQAAALDEANGVAVFGRAPGASSVGQVSYNLANLTNDFGKVPEVIAASGGSNSNAGEYWGRSIAAVPPFSATIACNYNNAYAQVFPYEGPWVGEDSEAYTVQFDMGESGLAVPYLYPVAANKAGTFLYGVDKGGAKIYKFAITADAQDATKIGSLDYVASWDFTNGGDLKGIGVGTFNGNDVVYMAKNASRGLWTLDVATGALAKTGAEIDCEVYDIAVIGQANGSPRLFVAGGANIFVFDLAADGTLLVDSPVFKMATASLYNTYTTATRFGAIALDDESRFVIASSVNTTTAAFAVVEKKPANLIVRGTFDDGATVTETAVAFGDSAEVTFNAPAGTTITAVTVNGVAQTVADGATSFTYEAAELTEYVYVAITAETPKYTVSWADSARVVVSNATEEITATTGEFEAGTVLTFYPTEGSITNVTLNAVEVADPATPYAYTVTTDAEQVLKVFAGKAAQAEKPAWAADSGDGSVQDKYWDWAEAHAAGQDLYAAGADYSKQYLLNVDANVTPTLHIDSVEVTDEGTKIVVSAEAGSADVDLEAINGVLDVYVGNSLGSLTKKAIPAANLNYDANGKAEVIIPAQDGKFVKAGVDYSAPAASITEISE